MAFLDKTGLERLWTHIVAKFVSREEYENTSVENLTGVLPIGNGGTNSDTVKGAQANILVSTSISSTTNINSEFITGRYHADGDFSTDNGWPETITGTSADLIIDGYVTGVGSGDTMGVDLGSSRIIQRVIFQTADVREYVRVWQGESEFSEWRRCYNSGNLIYSESEPEHVAGQIWLQPIS